MSTSTVSNSIVASLTFSFKGEVFVPKVKIDLDSWVTKNQLENIRQDRDSASPFIYPLLAADIDLDTYSYAYEVMLAGHIVYSEPTGIAQNHLEGEQFNYLSFYTEWQANNDLAMVQQIAQEYLSVTDLEQQPRLKEALLAALFSGGTKNGAKNAAKY